MSEQEKYTGTQEVRPQHRFDTERLETYLTSAIDGFTGPLTVREFKGGQSNPTYQLVTPGERYVLRRKPPGKLLPSAHAVDREYRVITALAETDVPVARSYCLCEDDSIIGTAFYVMENVEGRVFWDPELPELTKSDRTAVYDAMNDVLARLHNVDYEAVGLATFGKQGEYVARQIHRWSKQYRASVTEPIEAMDRLMEWLPEHLPEIDETTLVHGDYRLDNMIFHPTKPKILAILDWELSTLGDPLADLSYHCMGWEIERGRRYGFKGIDLASLGIPSLEEYVRAYCRRTGRDSIHDWNFYLAYNLFRSAAIAQGIVGRIRDGTAASAHAQDVAAGIPSTAAKAWEIAQRA